jgi:predicted RNA binding protein YcfA (HicA-like mRNA interferase family)
LPKLAPVSQRELILRLRKHGYMGPFEGGKHPYMVRDDIVLTIPNQHHESIGVDLLIRILRQAQINREEWLSEA